MKAPMAASKQNLNVLVVAPRIDLCLDFGNTVAWRGSAPEESLHSFADLIGWCVNVGAITERGAAEYRALEKSDPLRAAQIFNDAIAMREAIYRIVYSTTSGAPAAETDLRLLNDTLKGAPARTKVERAGRDFAWRVERLKPAAAVLLAPVLWASADLLVGPNLARVRHCANDGCLWLFLDDSKNGTRRWCSMQACGNRAKAHRHYLRQAHQMKRGGSALARARDALR